MQLKKNALFSVCVFAVSFFMILLFGNFDPEAYLMDDNRTQWFPVIERAYSDFFSTGTMPVYDFFQMKGFSIAEQGYYAVVNPVMMLSYILSNFTPLPFSAIAINIAFLFSLGNVCFFLICREFKQNIPSSLLLTAAYSVGSCFYSFSYWYYVFNNYLFIPLLILVFMKSRGRKIEYFSCGLVLALEILFGNVQYTFYHYIVYGFICLAFAVLKNRRYIMICISNVLCAGILSVPYLLLLVRASNGFDFNEFDSYVLGLQELILGSMLPIGILDRLGISNYPFFYNLPAMGRLDYTWFYNGGIAAIWLVLLIYAVRQLIRNKKKTPDTETKLPVKEQFGMIFRRCKEFYSEKIVQENDDHILIIGSVVCLLFFVSLVSGGIMAVILAHMPVIKQFRYLFKCIFVIVPVLAVITAAVFPYIHQKQKKTAVILCGIFTAAGLVNTWATTGIAHEIFTAEKEITLAEERERGSHIVSEYMPDADEFRYITLIQSDRFLMPETFHYYNGFLRNFATTMGIYSISGYEIAAPESHIEQISALYFPDQKFTCMVNSSSYRLFAKSIREDPEKVRQQLISNSVKYIFVQKELEDIEFEFYAKMNSKKPADNENDEAEDENKIDYVKIFFEAMDDLDGVYIEEIRSVNDYYDVIVLNTTNGLCTDADKNSLPITAERMDLLYFEGNGSPEYTLSFSYEDELIAYSADPSGNRTSLDIAIAEDGNTIIRCPSGTSNGRIYLGYSDSLCSIGFVFEIVIVVLFLAMLAVMAGKPRGKSADNHSR